MSLPASALNRAANQSRVLFRLLAALRPHWRRDRDLPNRIRTQLAGEKSFGSRDRRLYRELIYTTIRYLPWIEPRLDSAPDAATTAIAWLAADTPATAGFRTALTSGWPACPTSVSAQEAALRERLGATAPLPSLLPEWFRAHCPAAFEPTELNALHTRPPLWLRFQAADPEPTLAEFAARGWLAKASPFLAGAYRIDGEVDVTKTEAHAAGAFEIQDLGSQLILAAAGIAPGGHWLDACAGAGGKTLQLAALLGPTGRIDAHDIRPAALEELAERARRARIPVAWVNGPIPNFQIPTSGFSSAAAVSIVATAPAGPYDGVLIDAPCSGSGTWRRASHLKWTTTSEGIASDASRQRTLLDQFGALVKPGGRLIYATCSLSRVENEDVIASFLAAHPEFFPAPLAGPTSLTGAAPKFHLIDETSAQPPSLTLLPSRHDTNGFFVAALRRGC